jgi:hypothetical protein
MVFRPSLLLVTLLLAAPAHAASQEVGRMGGRSEVFVNSEMENYLRYLQTTGEVALYPWSIRAFSPREVDRLLTPDSVHPWASRYMLHPGEATRRLHLEPIDPRLHVAHNTAFPYGRNNGPAWFGRGATLVVQAGVAARYGPLSLTVAPVAFLAQNSAFTLQPNGHSGPRSFADGWNPHRIDLPQKFGDDIYSRLDPGQSTLRLDLPQVTVGISTANQHWGPASEHPLLLGNNAPGFLHAFAGTATPADLWVGRAHVRGVWGRLEQSAFSPMEGGRHSRLMTGLVMLFVPRGVPGLEVGLARFYHDAWPANGLGAQHLLKPFDAFFKHRLAGEDAGDDGTDPDNQLASVFARWVFPNSGFEIYGEYGREDHNWDLRDLLLEPDHMSGYLLGLRKQWRISPSRFVGMRAEVLNASVAHLVRVRPQVRFYVHGKQRQGHTHRGQILGSAAAYGGAGSLLGVDLYSATGRVSLYWGRELRQPGGGHPSMGEVEPERLDVQHSLGADLLVFRGRFEIAAGVAGVQNFNRFLGDDVFNLRTTLGLRTAVH